MTSRIADGWTRFSASSKSLPVTGQRLEHLWRDRAFLEVDARHDPAHRLDRRLARQRGQVRAHKTVSAPRQQRQIDPAVERHAARVDRQDFPPPRLVRHADHDFAVETPRPPQRLVDRLRPVGRAITTRFCRGSSPSSKVSSWATILFSASPETCPRLGAMESISSMK
jgi:hypothetical protein